jgi:hypothetical protein
MTIQERKFNQWHTSFKSNPILDGSSNDILKVKGRWMATVKAVSSEMRRNFNFDDQISDPYWTNFFRRLNYGKDSNLRERCDSIWKTLTMFLLPRDFPLPVCRRCFSMLWTPQGRGAIPNLGLIEWLDSNFDFEFLNCTLQEWSQMFADDDCQPTPEQLSVFIATIDRVLSSEMKIATIRSLDAESLVMVHPKVQMGDRIYALSSCSIPVALRPAEASAGNEYPSYHVIGGVYWQCFDPPDLEVAQAQVEILTLH